MKKKTIFMAMFLIALMAGLVYAFDITYINLASPEDDYYWSINQDNISFVANCSPSGVDGADNLVADIIFYSNSSGTYSAIVNDSTGGLAGAKVDATFTAAQLNLSGLGEGETFEWAVQCIMNGTGATHRNFSANRTVYTGNGPTFNTQTPSGTIGASNWQNITINVSDTAGTEFFNCDFYTNRSGTNHSDAGFEVEYSFLVANVSEMKFLYEFDEDVVTKWNVRCERHPDGNYYRWGTNRSFKPNETGLTVTLNDLSTGDYINNANYSINYTPTSEFVTDSNCWLFINDTLNETSTSVTSGSTNTMYWHSADVEDAGIIVMCNDTLDNYVNTTEITVIKDTTIPKLQDAFANVTIYSCTEFGILFNATEILDSSTVHYGLGQTFATWSDTTTSDGTARYHNITFGYYTDLNMSMNITLTDLAGNSNYTVEPYNLTTPVGLCSGWSLYSISKLNASNMSTIESQAPVTEYVYKWNETGQEWLYKANGTGTDYELFAGDAVFIYSTLNGNWFRNYSYANSYSKDLDNGSNYLAVLDNMTFAVIATDAFKNATAATTSGNLTNSTTGGGRLQFRIEKFASWNNTGKKWVNKYLGYSVENTTNVGQYANNSLDALWLWSNNHVTYNSTRNYIERNWSTT